MTARYVISEVAMYDHLHKLIDIPDVEHVHVTIKPDGTVTAVPMRLATVGEHNAAAYVPGGMTAQRGLWVDAPREPA